MTDTQVLILGAGIAGSLTACMLHDKGVRTAIIDKIPTPMQGASRWNEGKIHLGYTYLGTDSIRTATLLQQGAAVFLSIIENIAGRKIPREIFTPPVIYLVDQQTLFAADLLWQRAQAVQDLLVKTAAAFPALNELIEFGKTGNATALQRISPDEAAARTGMPEPRAAWTTNERAVSAVRIADIITAALHDRGIPMVTGTVTSVEPQDRGWSARLADHQRYTAPVIVNCLWENRARIERSFRSDNDPVSIRWKAALFGRHQTQFHHLEPSTRILGPFGDVTLYGNGDAYLSWYPANRLARSDDGVPPTIPAFDPKIMAAATVEGLGINPSLLDFERDEWQVCGGYVVASGDGDIDRTASPLHERHTPGATEKLPGYISVDTGKFSLGPFFANAASALARRALARKT